MNKDAIHIVLASDANYLPGLEVTRATMIASCAHPERLEFHVFDEASLAACDVRDMPKWNTSHMPYLRLWLPQLLPTVDWVVYSDVDTIWNRDVGELWRGVVRAGETGEKSVYWVRDFASMRGESHEWIEKAAGGAFDWTRYACSGICVMNLRKMREMNFSQRVLELFSKHGVPKFPDQDVLNALFNSDSELLPSVWCAMGDPNNLPPAGEKCVYHLTGVGRHFHDAVPPVYPPQYQLWWRVRSEKFELGVRNEGEIPFRSKVLAWTWPLHGLARALPLKIRERIVRQWFFAKVLTTAF